MDRNLSRFINCFVVHKLCFIHKQRLFDTLDSNVNCFNTWMVRIMDKETMNDASEMLEIIKTILYADARGQGVQFSEAMKRAVEIVIKVDGNNRFC